MITTLIAIGALWVVSMLTLAYWVITAPYDYELWAEDDNEEEYL